ncbi:MAG: hypothetical protein QM765_45415 [Myxococcales bacterium]
MRTRPLALLFASALLAGGCGACGQWLGPDAEIAQYLQAQGTASPRFAVPGGAEIVLTQVSFDHVLVKPEGEGFTAVGQVDAEGTYGGATQVSYIGLERVPFIRSSGRWVPKGALLPAMQEVATLLLARHAAEEARDPAAIERLVAKSWGDERVAREAALASMKERLAAGPAKAQPKRWIVRVERERCEVLEETSEGSTRLVLLREAGQLRIASGTL